MAFNGLEKKALAGLSLLYATRMLGLFMVFPILSLYGADLQGADSPTLGLALGIYGLTQAFFQIPFGAASDRFGRKPLIVIGLVIFLLGSAVAATSDSVMGLIVGRALQGAGAISSVILAMLADYTREDQRSKSMAVVGAIIGFSFVIAVIIGPWIAHLAGLSGVFWFTSALAGLGIVIVLMLPSVPELKQHQERKVRADMLWPVFTDSNVMVLGLGVGFLHLTMTALFVALPVVLVGRGFLESQIGWVYAPVMILAFLGMVPLMIRAEKRNAHVSVLRFAAVLIVISLLAISFIEQKYMTASGLFVFFIGFNFIEAGLPSLLSRKVNAQTRGTAMGVFATCQFIGAAAGGLLGGILYAHQQLIYVVALGVGAQILWIVMLAWVKPIVKDSAA